MGGRFSGSRSSTAGGFLRYARRTPDAAPAPDLTYELAYRQILGFAIGILRSHGMTETQIHAEVSEALRVSRAMAEGAGAEVETAFADCIRKVG